MTYLDFYNHWKQQKCFNINQVLTWLPTFQRSNLSRWIKKGYLIKLRKEWYVFKEFLTLPGIQYLVANKIYSPSYVSLQTALSFYGIIPESVVDVTSVSSVNTMSIPTEVALCSYQKIKAPLFFGYRLMEFDNVGVIKFATPEKAILDFLYLNPYYITEEDMGELRFDEDFMTSELDRPLLLRYLTHYSNHNLERRVHTLLNLYHD